jgi:ribokinase
MNIYYFVKSSRLLQNNLLGYSFLMGQGSELLTNRSEFDVILKSPFDVIVCGSLHLDIVVQAPALPRIDETAVGSAWRQICGGKGGNQAVMASRAGARTAMIGCVGPDEFGKTLLANLFDAGVDVSTVTIDPSKGSGMSVAILQDNGDYGAVIVSGSNLMIDTDALPSEWATLGGSKVLVLQNEVPHAVNVASAKLARKLGAFVVLNAAPARELGNDLLDLVDVLVVNRVEAEMMCGVPVADRSTAHANIKKLGSPSRSVIITLGSDGLVVSTTSHQVLEIEPIPVTVTSTHGAGDCFVGVLAAELAAGHDLIAACRVANQTAAAFVSRTEADLNGG